MSAQENHISLDGPMRRILAANQAQGESCLPRTSSIRSTRKKPSVTTRTLHRVRHAAKHSPVSRARTQAPRRSRTNNANRNGIGNSFASG
jgi:hypothetical protein